MKPFFQEGGYSWGAMPPLSMLPWGRARRLWEWLVFKSGGHRFEFTFTDAWIAGSMGMSRRWVQLAMAELQALGFIFRVMVRKVDRWGNTRLQRVMTMIRRAAGAPVKSKTGADLASKKFVHASAKSGDCASQEIALSSSLEEVHMEEQQTPEVGESDGTDPPSGWGGGDPESEAHDPAKDAEALAALQAQLAARRAAPRPATPPTPAAVASAQRISPEEALERAKAGKAAVDELKRRAEAEKEARLANREPAPPSPPPPSPVEPPLSKKSEPPRTFWQKVSTWSRRRRE